MDKTSARAANNLQFPGSGLPDSKCGRDRKKGTVVDITLEWEQEFVMQSIEAIPTTVPYAGQPAPDPDHLCTTLNAEVRNTAIMTEPSEHG